MLMMGSLVTVTCATLLQLFCFVCTLEHQRSSSVSTGYNPDNTLQSTPSSYGSRSRRSPFGWLYSEPRYTARSTRTFSDDEIDAFNQGLHRKRPKFIGKRHAAIDLSTIASTDANTPEEETDSLQPVGLKSDQKWQPEVVATKKQAPRKFLGRRSAWSSSRNDDHEDDSSTWPQESNIPDDDGDKRSQMVPRRKFVGKRTNRKFVGRRAYSSSDGVDDALADDDEKLAGDNGKIRESHERWSQLQKLLLGHEGKSDQQATESKRARKFVG